MKLLYDVETNGLLKQLDRIHCLMIRDIAPEDFDARQTWRFRNHSGYDAHVLADGTEVGPLALQKLLAEDPDLEYYTEPRMAENTIQEGVDMLMDASTTHVMGHNIIGFDEKALKKVFPTYGRKPGEIIDTLVLSRVICADQKEKDFGLVRANVLPGKLIGSHSLDAWGHRLGLNKGDYSVEMLRAGLDPWAAWNYDMDDYCVLDIDVNEVLWEALATDLPAAKASEVEHDIHTLATQISENGIPFDVEGAKALKSVLESRLETLEAQVKKDFGFWYAPKKKRIVRDPYPIFDEQRDKIEAKIDMLNRQRRTYVERYDKLYAAYEQGRPNAEEKLDASENQIQTKVRMCDQKLDELRGELRSISKVNAKPVAAWGEDMSRAVWADVTVSKRNMTSKKLGDRTEGSMYCAVTKIDFNPGSRHHIIDRYTTQYGWVPEDFTDKGNPQVDDSVLKKLAEQGYPHADKLAEIFFYRKLLGQLATGQEAWLRNVDEDTGRIHHYINTGGTVSGRCSHNSPNLGQIPGVKEETIHDAKGAYTKDVVDAHGQPYAEVIRAEELGKGKVILLDRQGDFGFECRSLFHVPRLGYYTEDGKDVLWGQVGADLMNIEFRMLAEVTAPYDDGELIDVVLSGRDVHEFNMSKTGVNNRGLMKRILFGLLYGAGDWKLGHTFNPLLDDDEKRKKGGELRTLVADTLPALDSAIKKAQADAEEGYLIGIDGRKLHCRHNYSALNLRLQSAAGILAKQWAVLTDRAMREAGYVHNWMGDYAMLAFVHDEIQTAVRKDLEERYIDFVIAAAPAAGKFFNLRCPIGADAKSGNNWAECH